MQLFRQKLHQLTIILKLKLTTLIADYIKKKTSALGDIDRFRLKSFFVYNIIYH